MAGGDSPARGPHAYELTNGLEYILKTASPSSGRITANDVCGMGLLYDHACATLFLAEVYGMCRGDDDELMTRIREALVRACGYCERNQNKDGGWGLDNRSDIAVTAMTWLALRSAHNAGIQIRKADMARLKGFLGKCRIPQGGFSQFAGGQSEGQALYPTSAGLRILLGMGAAEEGEVERCAKVLLRKTLGDEYGGRISEWDYCGVFFAVQAAMHEGADFWASYFPKTRDHLVRIQNGDGSWTIEYCLSCRAYATALACIVLQTPNRLLPMFQL